MSKKGNRFLLTIIFAILLVLQACSVKKYIPEGELLYTGAEIDLEAGEGVEGQKKIKSSLEKVLKPKPNSKFLGMRPGLLVHYKAQREKPGFINKFLDKRIGEEPVYESDVNLEQTERLLRNRLENNGFFYGEIVSDISENEKKKEAKAHYTVEISQPYILENYKLNVDSLQIYQHIEEKFSESFIKPEMRFSLALLKVERERIDIDLKEQGYYNFNPQFLIFEADTNQYDNKKFDLFLRLKKEVPQKSIIPYKINTVNVFPNYTIGEEETGKDTIKLKRKNFIQEEEFFKPKRLEAYILLEEGKNYSPQDSRYTSRRLSSIGTYKFVNIRYDEIDSLSTDSLGILEANIFLSPLKKRALRAELQGVTKSNNFAGPALTLTYSNRNLFHGGEILNLTGKFGYEVQMAKGDQTGLNSIQLGAQADLIFPRLLFPININNQFRYAIPKTKISLGGDYLNRSQLYNLGSVSFAFGYFWNANKYVSHQLNPFSVNYVSLTKTTEEFETILKENPFLRNSFNQEFIAGLTYSFTYNGMVDEQKQHQFFVNTNLDVAGNTIDLISGGNDEEPQTFFGLEYAQYAKIDVDFRYHLKVGSEQKIATRLFAGQGFAYGNSEVMPFSKQYYSGGPYSVRAFRTRSLGPGSYLPEEGETISFFDRSGNIRLEANLEYRYPIFSFLKGAVFADAGNVWTSSQIENLPGGKFNSNFLRELGIGVGTGLRVDIQNFVIRFDLAAPVKDPALPEGARWKFNYKDPVLNFAIGYPF